MTFDQQMMLAAEKQALDRSEREGKDCLIYRYRSAYGSVWYVRTVSEGPVEGATLEAVIYANGEEE